VIGVVLAGGASTRFGGRPKGLIALNGRAMALRIADMLGTFCDRVVIEAPRDAGYESLGLPLVHAPPEHWGKGPLAGLVAGLEGVPDTARVAFAPCDMPLLDDWTYLMLYHVGEGAPGAYAETGRGFEPLVAMLDASVRPVLLQALAKDELPRTHAVLDAAGAVRVFYENWDTFINVNTPADVAALTLPPPRRGRGKREE
jgi:molybdopterin-guanine dinucleotide biosynthesis protein A